MGSYIVRMLIALLLAAFLFVQARSLSDQPHRRRAFLLGAGALLALAGYNGALAAGAEPGPLQTLIGVLGVALFVGAIVSIVISFSAGEARNQREQIARAAQEYKERQKLKDKN